jgi:ACS family hexuronate transporter-like MFS transporter
MAGLVSVAIALSYMDRQTLPWTLSQIKAEYPFSDQIKALFDSAFLLSYGLMYLGGGRLLDYLGTRRGFTVVMIFWSLACASQGLAGNYGLAPVAGMAMALVMLTASRFLLGMGEGGGFPAATRVVTEWFPVQERSTAMGIMNMGTAVGAVAAPWFIFVVLAHTGWLGVTPWRWVFILAGALGLLWVAWWVREYETPARDPKLGEAERAHILAGQPAEPAGARAAAIPLRELLAHRETWCIVIAKFLSDAAWFFYMFWLPKFLMETFQINFSAASSVGWIPYAASGVGCLAGGGLSSWLLRRGATVNAARKVALGASAALMPWVMLVPGLDSLGWVIFIFAVAFFGQQSWSTLVMTLPVDMIPRQAVGTVAGLVGLGGALGGVTLGQIAGYLRDHGYGFGPVLYIAASLHLIAFAVICLGVPQIEPLKFPSIKTT